MERNCEGNNHITDSKACPIISNIGIYNAPQLLAPPSIIRNQSGEVKIIPVDEESVVYYTLDGSVPTSKSKKYSGPFKTDGKLEVRTIAFDAATHKSSPECREKFDISKKNWKIISTEDKKVYAVIDGSPSSAWHQPKETKLPADLVIDLGKQETLTGFKYFPDQGLWGPGIITHYQFFVSNDNKEWKLVTEGEFSNIKNNPLWQTKKFSPVKARYIKLRALKSAGDNDNIGYAELDVVTND
jgi:alpha-L-fucosidase